MKTLKVKLTLVEEMLGTCSNDPQVQETYISNQAPNAPSIAEEVAAVGAEAVIEKGKTVFPKENGKPFMWNYMLKGFFKDACSALARVDKTKSKELKAYKKIIDGLIFPNPRKVFFNVSGDVGSCQRPLRGQTAQGERVALANSETIPAGSTLELEIKMLDDKLEGIIREWLDYGQYKGLGAWRNSGKGQFSWEEIK